MRVLRDYLTEKLDVFAHQDHFLDLNNIDSPGQWIRQVFDVMATRTHADWECIAERLLTIDRAAASYQALLDEGRRTGHTVAKRQVRAVVKQHRVHAGEASFYPSLLAAYDRSPVGGAALRARLESGVANARRASAALADWLEGTYLGAAVAEDAAGRERYLRAAERHLGLRIDPEETYAWGWRQVHEIEDAMKRVAAEIRPASPVPDVIDFLMKDPARCAHSHDEFIKLMLERQLYALDKLKGTHFDVPEPLTRIEVKLAPKGGALGAYYMAPSEDLARAGSVWYSLGEQATEPLYSEVSTAYHEGFPGHHLQCGMQVYLADRLSRLHRMFVFYPGYSEGWALYAEQLMHELGFFERPDYVLGMLQAQLMRACRVVVDIGMHLGLSVPDGEKDFHPGATWGFDLAVEMMHARAFLPLDYAESEVTRYLGWPGQAIAYKVGQREILRLREDYRRVHGAGADLKDFHARVVGAGSVRLDLLREMVLGSA